MGTLEEGVKNAFDLLIKDDDVITIASDPTTGDVADLFSEEAEQRGIESYSIKSDEYGIYPKHKMEKGLMRSNKGLYMGNFSEYPSIQYAIYGHYEVNSKNFDLVFMPGLNDEIMQMGGCADYKKVQSLSKKVYDIVNGAKQIVVKGNGTDLIAKFDQIGMIKWIKDDLTQSHDGFYNFPAGEVFTCPVDVEGIVKVNGCLGLGFEAYGCIEDMPLSFEIKNSEVVLDSIFSKNRILMDDVLHEMNTDPNANRIGEFALGTNIYIDSIIGRILQDEKYPGIHLAWGSPIGRITGATWDSSVHTDAVITGPSVSVDGKMIMKDGKYII